MTKLNQAPPVTAGKPPTPKTPQNPARQLPNLKKMPILIVTSESSYHAAYDHCTVKYFEQAGVHPKWVRLPDVGIHGNGHMMMLEKNSAEIAGLLSGWLGSAVSNKK